MFFIHDIQNFSLFSHLLIYEDEIPYIEPLKTISFEKFEREETANIIQVQNHPPDLLYRRETVP